jgi:hypothetical protein
MMLTLVRWRTKALGGEIREIMDQRLPTISGLSSSVQQTFSKDDPVRNSVSFPALELFNRMLALVQWRKKAQGG